MLAPAKLENRLLAKLPGCELTNLLPRLESVDLPKGRILYRAGQAIEHIYFPEHAILSLVGLTEDGQTLEVGIINSEGVAGLPAILGAGSTPFETLVQLPGVALKISVADFKPLFSQNPYLHDLVLRYANTLLTQLTQTMICNQFHSVEERLCRWLLVIHDRIKNDTLPLTQSLISQMLGVRRATVSVAASKLQAANLIRYSRGRIVILDRTSLERAACECYEIIRGEIESFLQF